MKDLPLLAVAGNDAALFDILQEYAVNSPRPLQVIKGESLDADILLLCVENKSALDAQLKQARHTPRTAPLQTRILILNEDMEEPEDDAGEFGFAGIFRKPLRLAALLDTGFFHRRMVALKNPRHLSATAVFDPFSRALEDKTKGISEILTPKEADLLLALLEAGASGLSREAALTHIWGYHREADSHAVETALWRLRRKLESLFGDNKVLESREGLYFLKI